MNYYVFEENLINFKKEFTSKITIENDLATLNNVEELVTLRNANTRARKQWITKKINEGDLCFCSKHEGIIISYCWYSYNFGWVPLVKEFKVPENTVYSYDSYTLPEYRRMGVSLSLSFYAGSYLSKKGFQCLYFLVRTENTPNLKLNEKAGVKILGVLSCKKILFYRSYSIDSDTPENKNKIKKYCNIK